jgi:D-alanine-D-alanine ligase-like ATP-grasp enzyme
LFAALAPSPLLAYPLIVKPTSSYSSCGLTNASVVSTPAAALVQAQQIRRELGRVLAEEFVSGREFSMLIVGDWNGDQAHSQAADDRAASSAAASSAAASATPAESSPSSLDPYPHLRCYTAAERAFTASLPAEQQFLTFEQNYPTAHTQLHTWWSPLDVRNNAAHAREQRDMAALAKRAYVACRGRSYGRIDLRQQRSTGEFFCLEVNSLPGLSGELDSSVGAILSLAQPSTSFGHFLYAILFLAVHGQLDELPAEAGSS